MKTTNKRKLLVELKLMNERILTERELLTELKFYLQERKLDQLAEWKGKQINGKMEEGN